MYQAYFNITASVLACSRNKPINDDFRCSMRLSKNLGEWMGREFVAIHSRQSINDCERNVSCSELKALIKEVRASENFAKLPILIITENEGAELYRRKINEPQVYYSSDLTKVISDHFILASLATVYIQWKGGGAGYLPIFGDRPYFYRMRLGNEFAFNSKKCQLLKTSFKFQNFSQTIGNKTAVVRELRSFLGGLNLTKIH